MVEVILSGRASIVEKPPHSCCTCLNRLQTVGREWRDAHSAVALPSCLSRVSSCFVTNLPRLTAMKAVAVAGRKEPTGEDITRPATLRKSLFGNAREETKKETECVTVSQLIPLNLNRNIARANDRFDEMGRAFLKTVTQKERSTLLFRFVSP